MTNYLLPLLLGVCWIGNTIAEDRTIALLACGTVAAEGRQLQRTLTAHIDAIRNRDLKALTDTITAGDSLTLIFPNGTITNTRQAYVDFHRKWFADQDWNTRIADK